VKEKNEKMLVNKDVELQKVEENIKIKIFIERTLNNKTNINLSFRQIVSPT
jgi:hypothetical protein